MTDVNTDDAVVDEGLTTEPSDTSTVVVDEDSIRERVRAELEAEWQKERHGLQSGIAEERRKRQEYEQRLRQAAPTDANQTDVDAIVERKLAERDAAERARREQESVQQTAQRFHERKAEVAAKYEGVSLDDAARVVGDALSFSRELQIQLMNSDKSWDLVAYLHQHPDVLSRLTNTSEIAAGIELGRIESSLGKRSVTNAPSPITPVSGGSSDVDDIYELDGDRFESELRNRNGGSVFPR
jgi:hypothetical protein